jgi:hypothetical protein
MSGRFQAVDLEVSLDPNVRTRRVLQGKIVRLESVVSHQCIRPRVGADAPGASYAAR